jgi:hypothetical protein
VLVRALEAGREAVWDRRRAQAAVAGLDDLGSPDGERVRPSNVEALAAVADLALTASAGDRPTPEGYQVVVHVDAPVLAADTDGRCRLADGQPLAVETARRISCDGSLVELLEREGRILSVGEEAADAPARPPAGARCPRPRLPVPRLRADPVCGRTPHPPLEPGRGHQPRQPGVFVSAPPPAGARTRLHRPAPGRGGPVRERVRGRARERAPPPPPSGPQALPDRHRRLGLRIDQHTCRNGTGDRMNLPLAVDAIITIAG